MPAVIESFASVLKEFHILASLSCLLHPDWRGPGRRRPAGTASLPAEVMVLGPVPADERGRAVPSRSPDAANRPWADRIDAEGHRRGRAGAVPMEARRYR